MANIILKDLVNFQDNNSSIQDLSESELALQGGGFFKFRRRPPAPPVHVNPPVVIPDILIGFTPGLSI